MKSYIQLTNIASTYFDVWTSDGIDTFHADPTEVTAWLKREDLRTAEDSALNDLTDEEIERIASMIADMVNDELIGEVPAPDTLQDLTGQESGIVIYDSGEMIICNWCQAEDHSLPTVLEGICLVWWDNGEDVFSGAKEEYVEDYRPLLDGKELIWDQLDDMKHITTETNKNWFRATVYTLTNGTVIIAPKMWN